LLGTIAALRADKMKNVDIKITERKTRRIGLVVYTLSPKIGGSSKSLVLGGTNPSPSAERSRTRTHTPHRPLKLVDLTGRRSNPMGEGLFMRNRNGFKNCEI
jgi:hypothetical protein